MKKCRIFLIMLTALLMTSCFATRTYVGTYRETVKGMNVGSYNYSKGKQCYLFWGLVPLGKTAVQTPVDGCCEIKTRIGFGDFLVSAITGGLFSMQTIKVSAPSQTQNVQQSQPARTADSELESLRRMLD